MLIMNVVINRMVVWSRREWYEDRVVPGELCRGDGRYFECGAGA